MDLVEHAAFAGRVWSVVAVEGQARAEVGIPEKVDPSLALEESDTIASLLADYQEAAETALGVCTRPDREIAAYSRPNGNLERRVVGWNGVEG